MAKTNEPQQNQAIGSRIRKPSRRLAQWQISQITQSPYTQAKSRLIDRLLLISEGAKQ